MKMVPDWPFRTSSTLRLSKQERATFARAAALAEQAAALFEVDSTQWLEWKALEMHAREASEINS